MGTTTQTTMAAGKAAAPAAAETVPGAAAGSPDLAAVVAEPGILETAVNRFHEGGFFMWFILAVGIYALILIAERGYVLYLKARPVAKGFRDQLRTFLANGDLEGARKFAASSGNGSVGPIVEMGIDLKKRGAADDEIQSRLDDALGELVSRIDKRTAFLAVVGNVATLIGLLGTIGGMITSFAAVSGATASERAAMLSMGISEAMNCTAFGLLVAIPALAAYAMYQSKTESLIAGMTGAVSKIYNDLVYLYEPQTQKASGR